MTGNGGLLSEECVLVHSNDSPLTFTWIRTFPCLDRGRVWA